MSKRIMILLLIHFLLVFFESLSAHANNLFVTEDRIVKENSFSNNKLGDIVDCGESNLF